MLAVAPPLFGNNSFVVGRHHLRDVRGDQRHLDADHRHRRHLLAGQPRDCRRGRLRQLRACRCISASRGGRCGSVGPLFGLVFGVFIAIPAIRLEGFYYALLTVGIAELCRVYVVQSQPLGAANGGLFGADSFVPDGMSERGGLSSATMPRSCMMLGALTLYRMVNGQRLGRLLRAAPEKHEAFAEALGINYRAARIQVFLISSAALGGVGGFYATLLHGASPSLFTIDQLLLLLAMIVIGGIGTTEGAVRRHPDRRAARQGVHRSRPDTADPDRRRSCSARCCSCAAACSAFPRSSWHGAGRSKASAGPARSGKGGEVMPDEATEIADKQAIYRQAVRRAAARRSSSG